MHEVWVLSESKLGAATQETICKGGKECGELSVAFEFSPKVALN